MRWREAAASLGIVFALFERPNAMAIKLLLGIIAAFSLTVTANADQLVAINNLFLSLDDPLGDKTGRTFGPWIAFNTYNNTGTPIIIQVRCTIYDAARRVIGSQVVAAHVRDVRPPDGGLDMAWFDVTSVPIMGYGCMIESVTRQ